MEISNVLEMRFFFVHHLQRSHILAKSLNGEDKPENYFLLCPQCHAESPDTTDAKLFFAWVRYKRTHENYSMVLRRDMKKAAEILGVDQNLVEERFAALRLTRLEEDAYIRVSNWHFKLWT